MTISPINLGSFYTNSSGATVASGISSGIDTGSLITALTASQTAQVTKLTDQVTVNNSQLTALTTLNQNLTALQTSIKALSNPNSGDTTTNLFAVRTSNITSNTTQAASNYINATVASGTASGDYTITDITQLATKASSETNAFTLSSANASVVPATPTAGYFTAGTFQVKGQNITINQGDSLATIAQSFNNVSSSTGISASVLQTSSGQYKLIFTSTTTGAAGNFDLAPALNIDNATATIGAFTGGAQSITFHGLASADTALTSANSSLSNGALSFTSSNAPAETTLGNVTLGTTTLNSLAAQINSVAGYTATVTQSGSDYSLTVTQTTPGTSSGFDSNSFTGALSKYKSTVGSDPSNVLGNLSFTQDTVGYDASFKLNNVAITRSSNNISDLISGVTLNLTQDTNTSPGATFTLQIAPDTASIATGVTNFAAAYNNFLFFYSQQTQIDSTTGGPATTAILYSDQSLNNIYNSVTSIAASLVKGLATGQPSALSDVGISFTDYAGSSTIPATANTLSVDSSTLTSLLTTNLSGVENVFGDSFNSSSSNVSLYQAPTNSTITNFTLNVVNSATPPTYTATYTDASNNQQSVALTGTAFSFGGGYSLKAPAGSVFDGMTLLYTGTGDESNINVNVSQGLLVTLNNQLTAALQKTTGSIAQDTTAITAKNTALNTQVTTINTQTATLKTNLLNKYSALEQAITKANSVLNLLNAQQLAGKSS